MKKIITPAVREEAEFICGVTGKPAVARLPEPAEPGKVSGQ